MAPKILLVDDELPILNSLKRVLRREGHDILVAQTGQDALATLTQTVVAVILCDYGLGLMTGAEVLAEAAKGASPSPRASLSWRWRCSFAGPTNAHDHVRHFLVNRSTTTSLRLFFQCARALLSMRVTS